MFRENKGTKKTGNLKLIAQNGLLLKCTHRVLLFRIEQSVHRFVFGSHQSGQGSPWCISITLRSFIEGFNQFSTICWENSCFWFCIFVCLTVPVDFIDSYIGVKEFKVSE